MTNSSGYPAGTQLFEEARSPASLFNLDTIISTFGD